MLNDRYYWFLLGNIFHYIMPIRVLGLRWVLKIIKIYEAVLSLSDFLHETTSPPPAAANTAQQLQHRNNNNMALLEIFYWHYHNCVEVLVLLLYKSWTLQAFLPLLEASKVVIAVIDVIWYCIRVLQVPKMTKVVLSLLLVS